MEKNNDESKKDEQGKEETTKPVSTNQKPAVKPIRKYYPLFILIILISFLFFYDLFFANKEPRLILQFYKIFISWPVIIFIFSVIFIEKFHQEIADMLNRIKSISLKTGQIEIEKQQSSNIKLSEPENNIGMATTEAPTVTTNILSEPENNYGKLFNAYKELSEAYNELNKRFYFEKTYNLIYKSQIRLLLLLDSTLIPLNWESIRINHYPRTMRNYPFNSYMYFLSNSGLVNLNPPKDPNPNVSITKKGKEFLEYLRTNNYTGEEKNNNL